MLRLLSVAAAAAFVAYAPAVAEEAAAPAIVELSPAEGARVPAGDVPFRIVLAAEGKLTELVVTKPDSTTITLQDWSADAARGTTFEFTMAGLTAGDYSVNYTVNHLTAPAGKSGAYLFTVE